MCYFYFLYPFQFQKLPCCMGFYCDFYQRYFFIVPINLRLVFSNISMFYFLLLLYFSIGPDFMFMHLYRVFQFSKMARISCCKNTHKDMLTKDPNFDVLLDTSGRITKTYQIEWPRVYSIFDNDDLSDIQND